MSLWGVKVKHKIIKFSVQILNNKEFRRWNVIPVYKHGDISQIFDVIMRMFVFI
jgi:hypothetical protein